MAADPLSLFAEVVGKTTRALQSLFASLGAQADAQRKTADAASRMGGSMAEAAREVRSLTQAVSQLVSRMGGVLNALPAAGPPPLPAAAGGALAGLSKAAGVVGQVAGAVSGVFQEVIGKARQFVAALSPSTILAFDQSLRSFQATVGYALEPMFQVLGRAFREVAGIIQPAMEALRPVVEQLADVFGRQLAAGAQIVARGLVDMAPLLKAFADVMEVAGAAARLTFALLRPVLEPLNLAFRLLGGLLAVIAEPLRVVGAAFDALSQVLDVVMDTYRSLIGTLIETITAALGFVDVKSAMRELAAATRFLISHFLAATATVLKFLGMDTALRRLIDDLKPKQGYAAAATGAQAKSFEQVAKDLALASLVAAGGAGKEEDKVGLSDILAEMEKVLSGQSRGNEAILKVLEGIMSAVRFIGNAVSGGREAVNDLGDFGSDLVRGFHRGLGRAVTFGQVKGL